MSGRIRHEAGIPSACRKVIRGQKKSGARRTGVDSGQSIPQEEDHAPESKRNRSVAETVRTGFQAATVANDRGLGLGAGFQWSRFRRSVTFDDGASVFLGMDLHATLKEKYRRFDGYRAKVRSAVKEYVESAAGASK